MEETAGAMIGLAFVAFYFLFIGTMVLVTLGSLVVTILAVWDCARRDFPDPNTRALWCVLIVMTKWLGALVYYIVVYRTNNPPLPAPATARAAPVSAQSK